MFFIIEKSEKTIFDFSQNHAAVVLSSLIIDYNKMETQKIVNFLNNSDNESSKFAAIK